MNQRILTLSFLALVACSKAETAGGTPPVNQNKQDNVAEPDKKCLIDKAKEAAGNFKENASAPLTHKSVSDMLGVANDLKAELGKAAGGQPMDMKALMAKAKDLKAVAEKHGMKPSELSGLVARVTTVMGAMNSGNVPESLKADVEVLNKHKAELQSLFQK